MQDDRAQLVPRSRPPVPPGPYLVVGLRRAGRAAAAALARRDPGASIRAWDAESRPDTVKAAADLEHEGAEVMLDGDGLPLLDASPRPRCLVKSPGVPFETPLVAEAARRGLEVLDEVELGWRLDGRPVIGVTGTNGKGTCVALLETALAAEGRQPILAGNTQFGPPLSEAAGLPGDVIVAELSSYQLAGSPCLLPEASLFTNIGQQHWDWHGSREAYIAAKRRMFIREDRAVGVAAVNLDDPDGRRLADALAGRGSVVAGYGHASSARYRVLGAEWSVDTGKVVLATPSGKLALDTGLAGAHNAQNVAGALALLDALGLKRERVLAAISEMKPVPGRFEPVSAGQPFPVIVDFAHNPEGIEAALAAGRELVNPRAGGRLRVLGGPLWAHDPAMRRAAVRALRSNADELVLTTIRWRKQEPLAPPPEVLEEAAQPSGCPCEVVEDRAAAIERVIAGAAEGDVVMLLGRGAIAGNVYDREDRPHRFVEAEVALDVLRRRFGSEGDPAAAARVA